MREQSVFRGAAAELVIPLNEQGVDDPAFKKLTDEEHRAVLLQRMRELGLNV